MHAKKGKDKHDSRFVRNNASENAVKQNFNILEEKHKIHLTILDPAKNIF